MRRRVLFASTLAAVVAAGGLAVTAAQANQGRHVQSSATTRINQAAPQITVVERAVSDTDVDVGPTGDSRGDLLAFANPVYNRTNSNKVGRDQGSCIRTVVG